MICDRPGAGRRAPGRNERRCISGADGDTPDPFSICRSYCADIGEESAPLSGLLRPARDPPWSENMETLKRGNKARFDHSGNASHCGPEGFEASSPQWRFRSRQRRLIHVMILHAKYGPQMRLPGPSLPAEGSSGLRHGNIGFFGPGRQASHWCRGCGAAFKRLTARSKNRRRMAKAMGCNASSPGLCFHPVALKAGL